MKTVKQLLMLIVVALALSSCGKDPESQEIRFSILGDSYSTFEGYVDPGTNDVWPYYENIHVTDVGQM